MKKYILYIIKYYIKYIFYKLLTKILSHFSKFEKWHVHYLEMIKNQMKFIKWPEMTQNERRNNGVSQYLKKNQDLKFLISRENKIDHCLRQEMSHFSKTGVPKTKLPTSLNLMMI